MVPPGKLCLPPSMRCSLSAAIPRTRSQEAQQHTPSPYSKLRPGVHCTPPLSFSSSTNDAQNAEADISLSRLISRELKRPPGAKLHIRKSAPTMQWKGLRIHFKREDNGPLASVSLTRTLREKVRSGKTKQRGYSLPNGRTCLDPG